MTDSDRGYCDPNCFRKFLEEYSAFIGSGMIGEGSGPTHVCDPCYGVLMDRGAREQGWPERD